MKTSTKLVALVLLVAGLAFGAAASGPWGIYLPKLQSWLGGGYYVGPSTVQSTTNKVTKEWHVAQDFNFDAGQAGDVRYGPILNVTGGNPAIGDDCQVSFDSSQIGTGDLFGCNVTADGGIVWWVTTIKTNNDNADAGFFFTVRSHQ